MLTEKTVPFIVFLLATSLSAFAQFPASFSFQKDDTLLRKNYYDQSLHKKELLLSSLDKKTGKTYKKIYEEQFEVISGLWKSTRPVTSPEAHGYLQSIVRKIISANSDLEGTDARVVFSRDWWPNAVSMGDGTIAINAGLLIHMKNEAELVFVLCHELAHYYLGHQQNAIKKYVETITSDEYQATLQKLSKTTYGVNKQLDELSKATAFNSRRHGRDNEAAADMQALLFMKKTGYDCAAAKTCLEMLDKVDDSLLYKQPDIQQVFNFKDYPFKKKWIQDESSIFSLVGENSDLAAGEKDSLKTHPDCSTRIVLLAASLSGLASGNNFLVNESLFNQLKKDFLIEIAEECFREKNLGRNLYYNLLLLQSNDQVPLATYSIARCLNKIFEYQKEHKLGLSIDNEGKRNANEYNLLLRMLARLRMDEIASLCYHFCDRYMGTMKDYPGFTDEMNKAKKNIDK